MPQKVILDVDTGTDDAVALMTAALHPDLELLAVTTVNGNVPLAHTTDNTLRVLDFIGHAQIPVYAGLSRPLVRHDFPGEKDYAFVQSLMVLVLIAIFGKDPYVPRALYSQAMPHVLATGVMSPLLFRLARRVHLATTKGEPARAP